MTMDNRSSLSLLADHLEHTIDRMGDDSKASMWIQLLTLEDRKKLSAKLAHEAAEFVLGRVSMKLAAMEQTYPDKPFPQLVIRHRRDAVGLMEALLRDWET